MEDLHEFRIKIASILIASTLFNKQTSDSGGKTLNFKVYEDNVEEKINDLEKFTLSHFISKKSLEEWIEEQKSIGILEEDKHYNDGLQKVLDYLNLK